MPRFICLCDERINYGAIPNPNEWLMISDTDFERFSGQIDSEDVYRTTTHALKCRKCGIMWVFGEGFSNPPQGYRLIV